jgi:hypothetical protein
MNSLSWLIYLASLSGSVSSLFSFLAVLGGAACVIGTVLSVVWTDGSYDSDRRERRMQGYEDTRKRGKALSKTGLAMLIAFGGVAAVLPGSNTIYAIAASEIGERVITDETVRGIAADSTKALQGWIKKQIEPDPKK